MVADRNDGNVVGRCDVDGSRPEEVVACSPYGGLEAFACGRALFRRQTFRVERQCQVDRKVGDELGIGGGVGTQSVIQMSDVQRQTPCIAQLVQQM